MYSKGYTPSADLSTGTARASQDCFRSISCLLEERGVRYASIWSYLYKGAVSTLSLGMLKETIKILLVEDNSAEACLVQEMLGEVEALQFQLIRVTKLAEALTCLGAKSSISVILLDWSLPDDGGLERVTQVLLASPDIPVVVLSSCSDEVIAFQVLQKGAQDYLVKGETNGRLLVRSIRYAIERQQRSQSLRESEAKFRTLYESTSVAVMLLDENGIFDANSAALGMFGFTQLEQLCGIEAEEKKTRSHEDREIWGDADISIKLDPLPRPSHLLTKAAVGFSPPVQPNGEDSLSLAKEYISIAIAEESCRFDWIYRKRSGEDFPAEVTLTLIELGNRKVLQAAIYDIGDRKATETQLLQAKEEAEAGSRAKSEFLATMSHELRTPLNAVLGLSQLMRQEIFGTLNDKQKEYISCIQSSGEHLLSLINDILDLSKVEAGKEQLCFVPLDIKELCEYCLVMVREQANDRGLKITLDIAPPARICIADERRCKQMLLNLLSNAVKFTLAGEVSLIVRKTQEGISFTVEDTGIGIAADKLPLLFEPFRQLDSGLNRRFPGTGLGLALTRSLARLHGGDVSVKSRLGQGSQFTLCLPDCPSEDLFLSSSPQELGDCEGQCCILGGNSRILLVENDQRSAMLLKDYLQVIGYRVEHLTDSTNFLDSVRNFKPSLILMDVQLEENYTGFDLLAALRREPDMKKLKVVMVTAMAMAGDRERCLDAGADDYLSKPIGIAQLEAVLMRYL